MKKTLVALAVAAVAATSANAAVVYNQDGTKVEVGGQLRLLLAKDKYERADLKYGSSRLVFKATQDLGDGYSALGNVEVRFNDPGSNDSGAYAKRLYAGFAKDGVGQITFGRQLTNLDDVGLSDFTYDLGGVNLTRTDANKDIRFRSADFAGFQFGLDYFFGEQDKEKYNHGAGFGTSLFYTAQLAQDTTLQFNAGFSQTKVKSGKFVDLDEKLLEVSGYDKDGNKIYTTSSYAAATEDSLPYKEHKVNAFIVGTKLATGPFAFAVDYSQSKATDNQDGIAFEASHTGEVIKLPINKLQQLEVGAKYNYLDNASVYGEYIYRKASFADSDAEKVKVNQFILGTDYKFAKNVITYVEASTANWKYGDDSSRDNKFRVGLRVLF
ncbi:porin [Gallibacterium salpingitidis]|uniref:Membrane protein n=1 Tax=Gallibacterium salpingitidis TaxID=505341 RepID=A0A1A7NXV2_9PAST|nr:porin [Gallibacterium salpingitidis]OBW94410.1 membrane protein [Gallibacterium salpingitidis]